VLLNLRHFISSTLVVILLAGGVPYAVCTPAVCAASRDCAAARCNCCGANCPLQKGPQKSHKHDSGCSEQCPLIAASKAVAITNVKPLAFTMLGVREAQPLFFGYTVSWIPPVHQPATLRPPTLLGLACALTI